LKPGRNSRAWRFNEERAERPFLFLLSFLGKRPVWQAVPKQSLKTAGDVGLIKVDITTQGATCGLRPEKKD